MHTMMNVKNIVCSILLISSVYSTPINRITTLLNRITPETNQTTTETNRTTIETGQEANDCFGAECDLVNRTTTLIDRTTTPINLTESETNRTTIETGQEANDCFGAECDLVDRTTTLIDLTTTKTNGTTTETGQQTTDCLGAECDLLNRTTIPKNRNTTETGQQATNCSGTECYVDSDYYDKEIIANISVPENSNEFIVVMVPEVMDNMTQIVTNQMEKQEHYMQNMAGVIENMTQLLGSQLRILNDRLPIVIPPKDCQDVYLRGLSHGNGVYMISPRYDVNSVQVYCDMVGGSWTIFQKRFDGSVDFYQNWTLYEDGFGSAEGEYWLGLKYIDMLTNEGEWELRIDMESFDGEKAYALYDSFRIDDAVANYRLDIGRYRGTAGDSLIFHNGMPFTTKDRDNDYYYGGNCAQDNEGAWWYRECARSNLNGHYLGPSGNSFIGNRWSKWKANQSLKRTVMKMRRVV